MEDERIIALFFARSEQAVAALAAKYERLIYQIAHNILGQPEDARECVNDTYLGVWNAIPPARPDPLTAFVCRIARNTALKRRRARAAAKRDGGWERSLDELAEAIPAPSAEEDWSAAELGRAVDRFLDTLDRESRVLFVRRYWFGDPVRQLAALTGRTENNVSVRLSRLRGRLRTYLEQEGFSC